MHQVIIESAPRTLHVPPAIPTSPQPITFARFKQPIPPKVLLLGDGSRAYWCRSLGDQSDIYCAPAVMIPSTGVHKLDVTVTNEVGPKFINAFGADLAALFRARVRWAWQSDLISDGTLDLVEDGPARQVWHEKLMGKGFITETWYRFYSGSRQIDFFSMNTWSDRKNPDWSIAGQALISCAEPFVIDMAPEFGWVGEQGESEGVFPVHFNEKFYYFAFAPSLGDAQSMWARGTILPLPVPGEDVPSIQSRLTKGASLTRAMMVSDHWGDHWFGSIPVIETRPFGIDNTLRHMFDPKRTGMQPNNGAAGGNYDFGSVPALAQSLGAFLAMELGSCESFYRRFMHYESDGSILKASDHPDWETWSMTTYTRENRSVDRLGKAGIPPDDDLRGFLPDFQGHTGMDWQHRSQNCETSILAMDGCYGIEAMVKHCIESDKAQNQYWYDSARATGRRIQTYLNWDLLVPDPRWREMSDWIISQVFANAPGINLALDKPVRPLFLGGDYAVGVSAAVLVGFWETSIAAVACQRAWKRWGSPLMLQVAQDAARTTAAAFFRDSLARIRTVNSCRFEFPEHVTGTQWPVETLENGPLAIASATPWRDQIGWLSWYAGGLLAYTVLPSRHPTEDAEKAVAAQFLVGIRALGAFDDPAYARFPILWTTAGVA